MTLEERSFIVRSFEEFKTLNDRAQRVVYAYVKNSSRSLQFRTSTRDKVEEKGLFLQKQPKPERKLCLNKTETLRI